MRKIQASLKRKQCQRFNTDSVDYRILVAGLESSGKSSIVSMIVNKEADHDTEPTRGVSVSAFTSKPLSTNPRTVIFHEVGGHSCCRGLMRYYYKCDAVIFVVDSSDPEQFTKEPLVPEEKTTPMATRTPNGSDSSTSTLTATSISIPPITHDHGNGNGSTSLSPSTPLSPTPSTTALSLMPPFSPSDTEDAEPMMLEGFVRRRSNGILRPNLNTSESAKPAQSEKSKPSKSTQADKPRLRLSGLMTLSLPTVPPKMQRSVSAATSNHQGNTRTLRANTAQRASDIDIVRRLTSMKQRTSLKPMTMNEAKCNSVQELISKLNYDLRDLDVPFLVLYNKANDDNPMSLNEHS